MPSPTPIAERLAPLAQRLAAARQSNLAQVAAMFDVLPNRLSAARAVQRELERLLASRFNPLDYLRTDELGLSGIVADLLDPNGPHGQGGTFLERSIRMIGSNVPWSGRRPHLGRHRSRSALRTDDQHARAGHLLFTGLID